MKVECVEMPRWGNRPNQTERKQSYVMPEVKQKLINTYRIGGAGGGEGLQ
jgi:hypothetical protein